ncbi:MAG: hypothetical protein ABGX16_11925 [Pirellulales bacterium]
MKMEHKLSIRQTKVVLVTLSTWMYFLPYTSTLPGPLTFLLLVAVIGAVVSGWKKHKSSVLEREKAVQPSEDSPEKELEYQAQLARIKAGLPDLYEESEKRQQPAASCFIS